MMNKKPLCAALAACSLLLAACGPSDEAQYEVTSSNSLLAMIPADTPFVMANLEPIPADIVDVYLERFAPFLTMTQLQIDEARRELEGSNISVEDQNAVAVLDAVLAEFDGKMNRAGLESLGLSLESVSAVYGNGLFPVARLGIGDAEKIRAMVARVEAKSGQSIPEKQYQGQDYWELGDDTEPMGIYLAILEDHVAMTAGPMASSAQFLPALLGKELPTESLADSNALEQLAREKGFSAYGVGYLDLAAVADELFVPDSLTAQAMSTMGEWQMDEIDPSCVREAKLMTVFVPRLLAGTTTVTANELSMRYQVEMEETLAGELQNLVSDVPPASDDPSRMMNASMSLEVGNLREFMLEKANLMSAVPFQCPQLQDLNRQVQELATSLNQPMPPFIGNFKGFRAAVTSMDPVNPDPSAVQGMFTVEMRSPQMVMGMASMMIPGFENLNIEPGADPVALPQELMTVVTPEFKAYAVMSKDAIGMAVGDGQQSGLKAFLDEDASSDDVVFSVDYDLRAFSDLQSMATMDGLDDDGQMAAMAEAYNSLLGRSRFEVRFDGEGITVDQRQTFQ